MIATRACVYWVLVSGLNLVVGFAGQIAIGWVALLTLGAYTTSVLVAGNVTPAFSPYLALAIAAVVGAVFGLIVGLPALRLRTFYFAITTLGFATIVTQVALAWQSVTGGGVGVAGPIFPKPFASPVGLLLFLLRPGGDLHLDDGEYRGKPLRPRTHRDPRRGGRGRSKRHLQTRFVGDGVPVQRRRCGGCRRAVRRIAILHHAGRVHARPVDPVLHRHPDRRARLHSRAAARHDSFDGAAGICGAIGRVVDVSLCGVAARHRACDPGRNCRDLGFQEPPPARERPRDHPAARPARAAARRAARCRRLDAGTGGAELRRGACDRRSRPRNPAGSSAWTDRPQRQRQDHDAERHLRLLRAAVRRG